MPTESAHFYRDLTAFADFTGFSQQHYYQPVPHDWLVVITDVQGSTAAIQQGRYKQVNAVGVACMVALNNALAPLQFPAVFGGDGITACLPASRREQIIPALTACRRMARTRFGLQLRIGVVALSDIQAAGEQVRVGKYQPHANYTQAMFQGSGLRFAEALIKGGDERYLLAAGGEIGSASWFDGFECRWSEIPSPHGEVISLLASYTGDDPAGRERVYSELLAKIGAIYGSESDYHPLRERQLRLTGANRLLSVEANIRCAFLPASRRLLYLLRLHLLRWVGWWLMRSRRRTDSTDWGRYKQQLIANTDYRKFDELLRMVIAGSPAQRSRLRAVLQGYRQRGELVFGIHSAAATLVTCIVTNYDTEHVHFLDGADGGYAMAAVEMKEQLASDGEAVQRADPS